MNHEELLKENKRLQRENSKLRKLLGIDDILDPDHPQVINKYSSIAKKVKLFRSLFQGRNDVYAVYWQSKKGKKGYSPKCNNEWVKGICRKPSIPCKDCTQRDLDTFTDQVIIDHLSEKKIIGIYPLLHDESCCFAAVDFDGNQWLKDSQAFISSCEAKRIPAYLEKSKSGNGAHVWFFFEHPIEAYLARKFVSSLLTETMERYGNLSFSSFDRIFPNQDRMPKGGFGNLIALPLQKKARRLHNTEFVSPEGLSYPDQWLFLSTIRRITEQDVEQLIQQSVPLEEKVGCKSWSSGQEQTTLKTVRKRSKVTNHGVIHANKLFITKIGLELRTLVQLKKLATFKNPLYYRNMALRLSNHQTPRFITCFQDLPASLALPRGCMIDALDLLSNHNVEFEIQDRRYAGETISSGQIGPQEWLDSNSFFSL